MPGARGVERRAMRHTDSNNEAPKPNECVQGRRNGPNQEHAGRRKINMSKSPGCRSRAEIWRLIPPSGKHETHNGQALRGRHSAAHSPPSRERKRFYARASVPGRPTAPTEIPAAPTRSGKGRTCTAPEFKPHLFYLSPSARSLNHRFVV